MTYKKTLFVLFIFCHLSWGCSNQGTDTGNPTSLEIKIVGIEGGVPTSLTKGLEIGGVTITTADIVVKEIDLDLVTTSCAEEEIETEEEESTEEEAEQEFEFLGPFVVDLLENSSVPDMSEVEVEPGTYCEIELNFDQLATEEIPDGILSTDPIVEQSLFIEGTREDGTPFEIRLSEDDRFKLEGSSVDGFIIDADSGAFFISFNFDLWFVNVDLNEADISDGIILIDSENNTTLRELIVENIKGSAQLFRDLDGDGVLGEDELDENLVLGEGVDVDEED